MPRRFEPVVYCLLDPEDGLCRYVGQSIGGVRRAYGRHQAICLSWERGLERRGLQKLVEVLEECSLDFSGLSVPEARLLAKQWMNDVETFWIASIRASGAKLLNVTDGGGGTLGWKQSPETIERRRQKLTGMALSEEARRNIGIATSKRGRPFTVDQCHRGGVKGMSMMSLEDRHKGSIMAVQAIREKCGHRVLDVSTGTVYLSVRQAAVLSGIPRGVIRQALANPTHPRWVRPKG